MSDLEFLTVARIEYQSAADWYAERNVATADRFASKVETAIESIRAHPEQHPRWDDRYRYYLVPRFPYFVAYRHEGDRVVIVAVRHTSQDSVAWTDR
jgi:plasmid stabilization system protein ParE